MLWKNHEMEREKYKQMAKWTSFTLLFPAGNSPKVEHSLLPTVQNVQSFSQVQREESQDISPASVSVCISLDKFINNKN